MKLRSKIILVVSIIVAIPLIFILSVYIGVFGHLQNKKELLTFKNATATIVLSEEGELIGKIFSENRTNISYDQVPQYLINALIATEDARFFEHGGVDSRGILRALIKTVLLGNESSGGGSTITQQLAKNMFGRKRSGRFAVFINKTKEIFLAHRLEQILSKEEILTLYLNTVPFGENVYGIGAASLRFFSKKIEFLTIQESAVLIGMLKANDYYNPRLHSQNAKTRRNVVLNQMKKYNYLNAKQADSLCALPLIQNYANLESKGPADYFLYQVKNDAARILLEINAGSEKKWNIEEDGLIINTTLNLTLQNYVNNSFHDHLSVMQKKLNAQYHTRSAKKVMGDMAQAELKKLNIITPGSVRRRQIFSWDGAKTDSISVTDSMIQAMQLLHAGLIAINPVTGAIKAWAGGIDFRTQPYDQVEARRQMASSFKPVLYAEALEEGISPCLYLDNDSVILTDYEGWSPENFDNTYGGKYTLVGALVHSMNVPTYNLFQKVSFDGLDSLWKKMGFSFSLENNPSLAMGTAEASIYEEAIAYSAFVNGGFRISPQWIVSIKSPDGQTIWENNFDQGQTRVLSERTCQLISAILQRAVNEGTGAAMRSAYGVELPLAGKTGTSTDYADAWFAAFNPSMVMVSRVGASLPSIHFNNSGYGSGSALALPLVALTLKKVQEDNTLKDELISPFPELPPELLAELDCPEFRDKNFIENFFDLFKKENKPVEKMAPRPEQKKKSFFQRIFGRRKNR